MESTHQATAVFNKMYSKDGFSEWLGIKSIKTELGHTILEMEVRAEMLNGFGVAHGGIVYSLCDSAFAFCCNSYNQISVSIQTSISHTMPIREADIITAEAKLIHQSYRVGNYEVIAKNQKGDVVACFHGVCYKKEQTHF